MGLDPTTSNITSQTCNPLRHAAPYQFIDIGAEPIVVWLQLAHTTYNLYDNLVYIDK